VSQLLDQFDFETLADKKKQLIILSLMYKIVTDLIDVPRGSLLTTAE